jgi:hypothetical protein
MRKVRRREIDVCEDGETVSVRMEMMDAWQKDVASWAAEKRNAVRHAPGYITSDAPAVLDARRKATQARDAWVRSKVEAWLKPFHIGDQPPHIDPQGAMNRYMNGDPDDDDDDDTNGNNDARERQYRDRCKTLENAWKTPTGTSSPGAATGIQRQGEAWRGGR